MIAVTTFPEWGWDVYARHCIETWQKFWPGSVLAYYEGTAPPTPVAGVEFRPLSEIEGHDDFINLGIPQPDSYMYDARRFSHKVFAQLDAMEDYDQFWWLDADVEMTSRVRDSLVQDITNQSFVAYLGRKGSYTETGVIAFNAFHDDFERFRKRYERCYLDPLGEGGIYRLPYWTDCHAFDYARFDQGHNLTPEGKGVDNVLRISPLANCMVHHKGRLKLNLEGAA